MNLSIIIVSYNVSDLLGQCIASISKFLPGAEIIVVDNNSSDGTTEMLLAKYPEVKLIPNKENVGFSAANNQGIGIATQKNILLLNPDTELKNGSVNIIINYLEQHTEVSILAPRLLNSDGTLQVSCWRFPTIWNIVAEAFFLNSIFRLSDYPAENFTRIFKSDFASGAALLFRKELTNKIGLLDPDLFWMDDVDYCYRAKTIGDVIYYPEAEIIHHNYKNPKKNYKVIISNQLLSKLKFLKKHGGVMMSLLAAPFVFLHIISRILIFSLLSPFKAIYRQKAVAYIYSLKKFFSYLIFQDYSLT